MSGGGADLPPPGSSAAWLARSVRDAEVAGSNPAFPTTTKSPGKSVTQDLPSHLSKPPCAIRARSTRTTRARHAVRHAHDTRIPRARWHARQPRAPGGKLGIARVDVWSSRRRRSAGRLKVRGRVSHTRARHLRDDDAMSTVDVCDLRDHVHEILDRVAAGESIVITVAGRPAAELCPLNTRPRFLDRASFVIRCLPNQADVALTTELVELALGTTDELPSDNRPTWPVKRGAPCIPLRSVRRIRVHSHLLGEMVVSSQRGLRSYAATDGCSRSGQRQAGDR
jgi:prevent-host-death family protein